MATKPRRPTKRPKPARSPDTGARPRAAAPALAAGELISGRIAGVFGVRGELKLDLSVGSRPAAAIGEPLELVLADAARKSAVVRSLRPHGGRWLIAFEDAADADAAQAYVGARVVTQGADLPPLGAGEYYDHDLVGCAVYDDAADGAISGAARALGPVARVEHWPASDVLILESGAMVPLVAGYAPRVDLAGRRITMTLPAGLIDPSGGITDD